MVLEGDLQARQQGCGGPVVVGPAGPAVLTSPPSIAEQCPDDVVAWNHQVGHCERLDLEPGPVRGPTRRQLGVAHPLAVHERLVQAVSRYVEHRLEDLAVDGEGAG